MDVYPSQVYRYHFKNDSDFIKGVFYKIIPTFQIQGCPILYLNDFSPQNKDMAISFLNQTPQRVYL